MSVLVDNLGVPIKSNKYVNEDFTPSQIEAIDIFTEWWQKPFNEDNAEFSIIGAAGTGKTYIVNYILNRVIDKACAITAPTHKALRVLENRCGRRGQTLQSLHGLRPNTDMETFSLDNPQFDPKGKPKIQNYNIIIIDEASMINTDLFDLNHRRAKEFRVRILYVLDAWQLPPVNEKISRSATVKNRAILRDIVRQDASNPLLPLFTILRHDIKDETNNMLKTLIKQRENIVDGKGYILHNKLNFTNAVKEYYTHSEFYKNVEYIRTAAYTNQQVAYWNGMIRNVVVEDTRPLITINDLFTSNITHVDEFGTLIIINSEDYVVYSVDTMITSEGIKVYVCVFISCYDGRRTSPILVLDHNHFDSYVLYQNIANGLYTQAIRNKNTKLWLAFFAFRKRILTLTKIKIGYKDIKPDISYGYALTTHKLQGSTLTNVAVDLVDILFPITKHGRKMVNEKRFANQLAYVALSRTENLALIQY